MSMQGQMILDFVLGIFVGAGGWYAGAAGRPVYALVPLLAAIFFVLLLVGAVKL